MVQNNENKPIGPGSSVKVNIFQSKKKPFFLTEKKRCSRTIAKALIENILFIIFKNFLQIVLLKRSSKQREISNIFLAFSRIKDQRRIIRAEEKSE